MLFYINYNTFCVKTFCNFMPFIAIAIRNSDLYTKSRKEAFINKVIEKEKFRFITKIFFVLNEQVLLELATIVFDEQTTVDNLVSKIISNSLLLLECEHCQLILFNCNNVSNSWITKAKVKHIFV